MTRKLLAIATCLLLVFPIASAFAGGQKGDGGDQQVELEYWTPNTGPQTWMVERFQEQNPNVSINQVDTPATEMRNLITAAMSSGTGPDVFYFELGLGQVQPLLNANLVIDMEEPAERFGWRERISDFALAEATHSNTLWAVPNEVEYIGMWYNKSIFAEIGAEIPTSWDELVSIAENAEAAGYEPFVFGMQEKWPALHRISLGYQWNPEGQSAVAEALFQGGRFNTDGFVEGLRDLVQLDRTYWGNAPQTSHNEAISAFVEGNVAMYHMGTWLIGDIQEAGGTPDDFGIFVSPEPGTSNPSTVAGAGGGWYINSSATDAQKEAGLQFLDFSISEESMAEWAKMGFVPPIDMDLGEVEGVPALTQDIVSTMTESMDQMGYFIHHFTSAENSQWIQDGYQGMLLGDVSPQEFADRFQELAAEARSEGFEP